MTADFATANQVAFSARIFHLMTRRWNLVIERVDMVVRSSQQHAAPFFAGHVKSCFGPIAWGKCLFVKKFFEVISATKYNALRG